MGQLKITMAQFFRINGGSTQNRGVIPDIRFPSAGDPSEYGERSLQHALPWSTIDPARYVAAGDMSRLVAVADNRYQGRMKKNEEFNWLLADIAEFNSKSNETRVSLLESVARKEMEEEKAKREKRKSEKEATGGPLVKSDDVLVEENFDEFSEPPADDVHGDEEEEEEGPDLLLREAARIVGDVTELESDGDLLDRKFSQLTAKQQTMPKMN
jgi:carboxyl-terminal processing protease